MKQKRIAAKAEATHTAPTPADSPAGAVPARTRVAVIVAAATRAIAPIWSIVTAPLDFIRWFFGDVWEPSTFDVPCPICSDPTSDYVDGHPPGVQCPFLMEAQCIECVDVVPLTRFGFCSIGGARHTTVNMKPAPRPIAPLYIVKS